MTTSTAFQKGERLVHGGSTYVTYERPLGATGKSIVAVGSSTQVVFDIALRRGQIEEDDA